MKQYLITFPEGEGESVVRIESKDAHSIIKHVEFSCYHSESPGVGRLLFALRIEFMRKAETEEMRRAFLKIQDITNDQFVMGYESLINQENTSVIIKYLELVQTIDAIPEQAFLEVMNLIPLFDISELVDKHILQEHFKNGQYDEALELALNHDAHGAPETLIFLINMYAEASDFINYENAVLHVPSTSESFVEVNKAMHEQLQFITLPADAYPEEKIDLLERKLRYALNGQLQEATHYFDELCGNTGLSPAISNVKGDPDTLIEVAKKHRQMKEELEQMRQYILNKEDASQKNTPPHRFF